MAEWAQPDGSVLLLEMEPIYCFNCGKDAGYIPKDVMSHACYLCSGCSLDGWGEYASQLMNPDQEFWDKVAEETLARFGRKLTHKELVTLGEQGQLGTALDLLSRESPYKLPSN
jgi:hypothetical protein